MKEKCNFNLAYYSLAGLLGATMPSNLYFLLPISQYKYINQPITYRLNGFTIMYLLAGLFGATIPSSVSGSPMPSIFSAITRNEYSVVSISLVTL